MPPGGYSILIKNQSFLMKKYIGIFSIVAVILFFSAVRAEQIRDIVGNTIEVPPYPQRIVSLAPSITECLFAIGAGFKVVGVTQFSNYPPSVQKLPKVGSYIYPSIEKIVALNPDLCVVTKDGNPRGVVYKLMSMGIKIFVVDPRDVNSLFNTMLVLGKVMGLEDAAKKEVLKLNKELEEVRKKARLFSKKPRVFFQIGVSPMVTVGKNTLIDDLISIAGGENIFGNYRGYPKISVEQVMGLNPDVIIITSMVHSRPNLENLKEFWLQYREIKAVKYKNIFVVNSDLFNRPSPRAIKGLKLLSTILEGVEKRLK